MKSFDLEENFIRAKGIKPFPKDRFTKQIEINEGGYGKVERCYDVINNIFVAHKFVDIFSIKMNQERRFDKVYGFLREIIILKFTTYSSPKMP